MRAAASTSVDPVGRNRDARPSFRPDVQGLRAVAVLAVVAFHSGLPLPGGYVGVDVFFVVSGFVITRLLVSELSSHDSVSFRDFYARRARRLMPAFALFATVTMVASVIVLSPLAPFPQQHALKTGAASTVFVANWFLYRFSGGYWGVAETANPFLHTWSLSVEEQFYLVLPALMALVWRSSRLALVWRSSRRRGGGDGSRRLIVAIGVVSAASLALSWALSTGVLAVGSPQRLAFFGTPTRVWEFGAGALVALAGRRLEGVRSPAVNAALGSVGTALIAYSLLRFDGATEFPGIAAAIPVAGTALLIVAGAVPGVVRSTLSLRPLGWVGDRSYGWYLWHWPMIVFATVLWPESGVVAPVAAVAALLPTAASYRYLEQRVRSDGRVRGARAVRLAAVCMVVPMSVAVLGVLGARSGWGLEQPPEWSQRGVGFEAGCHSGDDSTSPWPAERCTFRVPGSTGLLLLVGDSHAAAMSSAVVAAGHDAGFDVAVWTRSGCPFAAPAEHSDRELCSRWERQALALVGELRPEAVVIVNRASGYSLAIETVDDRGNPVGGSASTGAAKASAEREWLTRIDSMIGSVEQLGSRVIVVADTPEWGSAFPDGAVSLARREPQVAVVGREEMERRREPIHALQSDVVARHDALLFDPLPTLCPGDDCRPEVRGRWLFFDDNHLTEAGSMMLADALAATIESVSTP